MKSGSCSPNNGKTAWTVWYHEQCLMMINLLMNIRSFVFYVHVILVDTASTLITLLLLVSHHRNCTSWPRKELLSIHFSNNKVHEEANKNRELRESVWKIKNWINYFTSFTSTLSVRVSRKTSPVPYFQKLTLATLSNEISVLQNGGPPRVQHDWNEI